MFLKITAIWENVRVAQIVKCKKKTSSSCIVGVCNLKIHKNPDNQTTEVIWTQNDWISLFICVSMLKIAYFLTFITKQ